MVSVARGYGNAGLVLDQMADEIGPTMARSLLKAGSFVGGEIARTVIRRFPGGTGALARSFLPPSFVRKSQGSVTVGALSRLPYAATQDKDRTVIRPKSAKMLAIPLTRQAKTKWPRDWPSDALALIKTKKGNLLLIDAKRKRTQKLIAHYVLKDKVTIHGRGYLAEAAERSEDDVERIMTTALGKRFDAVISQTRSAE